MRKSVSRKLLFNITMTGIDSYMRMCRCSIRSVRR